MATYLAGFGLGFRFGFGIGERRSTAVSWAYHASRGMASAYCTSLPRSGKCVNHASAAGERKRWTRRTLSQCTRDASVMSSGPR